MFRHLVSDRKQQMASSQTRGRYCAPRVLQENSPQIVFSKRERDLQDTLAGDWTPSTTKPRLQRHSLMNGIVGPRFRTDWKQYWVGSIRTWHLCSQAKLQAHIAIMLFTLYSHRSATFCLEATGPCLNTYTSCTQKKQQQKNTNNNYNASHLHWFISSTTDDFTA